MLEPSVTHSTFVLERTLPAPPAAVFRAFDDPDLRRRWHGESAHHDVEEFVGRATLGAVQRLRYRMREGTPIAGMTISTTDTVLDVVPDARIVSASRMCLNETCISAALVTVELLGDDAGTRLILTFQGAFLPGADGPAMREEGWRTLLDRLAGSFADAHAAA